MCRHLCQELSTTPSTYSLRRLLAPQAGNASHRRRNARSNPVECARFHGPCNAQPGAGIAILAPGRLQHLTVEHAGVPVVPPTGGVEQRKSRGIRQRAGGLAVNTWSQNSPGSSGCRHGLGVLPHSSQTSSTPAVRRIPASVASPLAGFRPNRFAIHQSYCNPQIRDPGRARHRACQK